MLSISDLECGSKAVIVGIDEDMHHDVKMHLEALGIFVGQYIEVFMKKRDMVVIKVYGTKLALTDSIAVMIEAKKTNGAAI